MQRNEKWDQPFDILNKIIDAEIQKNKSPSILLTSTTVDPNALRHEAGYIMWNIYKDALNTLKQDGHDETLCGDLALAKSRASLRKTPLAETLGMSARTFERDDEKNLTQTADENLAHNMLEDLFKTAQDDIYDSCMQMEDYINLARMDNINMPDANPMLKQLFATVMRGQDQVANNLLYSNEHRQMAVLLRELVIVAKSATEQLLDEIQQMKGVDVTPTKPKYPPAFRTDLYGP